MRPSFFFFCRKNRIFVFERLKDRIFFLDKVKAQGRTWAILKNTHLVNGGAAGGSPHTDIMAKKPIIGGTPE